ncbi:pentapeptide repeat-containing protein [Methylocapsa sp. D3K7]|uniref:pentapeptide repeat-containing protein n=1 Tax=Methylocapsa sp. D3K7 TaxID=3041435 RepID=UPI00244E6333|nr:pentapeptide repeat-containing protein [Methylocapsa sp. D3K7]WGJ14131.1 pentapeptide repeat-containing protein [Methylocapsa sp. D3K7]
MFYELAEDAKPSAPDTKEAEALAASLNHSAERVQTLWFSFLIFMLYLAIATGTTTHRMLFLESPLNLPVLNIPLPLLAFYILTPIIFVTFHFYMLLNLVLLARTANSFEDALQSAFPKNENDENEKARENFRMRIENTLFVQLLVGGRLERKGINAKLLSLMALITLALAPVALLLMIQIKFLPYHSEPITWLHRGLLALDLALVWTLWPGYRSGWGARLRPKATWGLVVPGIGSAAALAYAVMVATFPDERIYLATQWLHGSTYLRTPTNTLDLHGEDLIEDTKLSDIIKKNEGSAGAQRWVAALFVAGRDLTGANLREADVRHVDFSDAILNRANLNDVWAEQTRLDRAQLRDASLRKAQLEGASLHEVQLQGTSLKEAQLQGAQLNGAHLRGALNLPEANLRGASLDGAELQGASLEKAQLQGASLREAQLQGASLKDAELQGASLDHARLEGTSLENAQLQGASLNGAYLRDALDLPKAQLQGASLKKAQLQGASLDKAHLQGATLDEAELRGASLHGAELQGASLNGAHLQGASLNEAQLQGALLFNAQLQGASLDDAQLQGALLFNAQLQGASLETTKLDDAFIGGVFGIVCVWRADARTAAWKDTFVASTQTGQTGPKGDKVKVEFLTNSDQCDWTVDSFAKLKQLITEEVPEGENKDAAMGRIEQRLDPTKALEGENEIAKMWTARERETPTREVFERNLAGQWREVGCAGTPSVLSALVSQLEKILDLAVRRDVPKSLAAAFLDEAHCASAPGLSEADKAKLKKIAAPTVPQVPKP